MMACLPMDDWTCAGRERERERERERGVCVCVCVSDLGQELQLLLSLSDLSGD